MCSTGEDLQLNTKRLHNKKNSRALCPAFFLVLGFFGTVEDEQIRTVIIEHIRAGIRLQDTALDIQVSLLLCIIRQNAKKVNRWRISGGNVSDRRRVAALFLLENMSRKKVIADGMGAV